MSTKIYNAFKYKGKLSDLISDLKDIKQKYIEFKIDELSKFANLVIKKKENDFLEEDVKIKDLYDLPLGDLIFSEYLQKQIKLGYNNPINIDASCVVYSHKKNIYIQFFGIRNYFLEDILYKLDDFHYQNSTDMTNYDWDKEDWEKMTSQRKRQLTINWNNRRKIWSEIINGYDTFAESGLIFNFYPNDYKLSVFCNDVLKKINENEFKN